jgi:hypothetical protein
MTTLLQHKRMHCADDPTASHERSLLDWPAARDHWGCAQEEWKLSKEHPWLSYSRAALTSTTSGEAILERTRRCSRRNTPANPQSATRILRYKSCRHGRRAPNVAWLNAPRQPLPRPPQVQRPGARVYKQPTGRQLHEMQAPHKRAREITP